MIYHTRVILILIIRRRNHIHVHIRLRSGETSERKGLRRHYQERVEVQC